VQLIYLKEVSGLGISLRTRTHTEGDIYREKLIQGHTHTEGEIEREREKLMQILVLLEFILYFTFINKEFN